MKNLYRVILIFSLFAAGWSSVGYIQNKTYGESADSVFSVTDKPYNHTFSYWVEKWFNWFLSLPNIQGNASLTHPRDSYSPEKCSWNQNKDEPVWMLSDGPDQNDLSVTETRDCKVPAGKALLVQIVGSNCSPTEGYKNDQELMDCAKWILPQASFSASVDGKDVMNTNKDPHDRDKFYVQPFVTNITYGKNNYYGDPEGTYRGMEAGYFFFVKPLPVGNHTIKYQESVINALDSTGNDKRISNLQYNIVVENSTVLR